MRTKVFCQGETILEYHELLAHAPAIDWVGSSGTVRTLQGLDTIPKDSFGRFSTADLQPFIENLRQCTTTQITEIRGIDPRRADIILSGCLILDAVTESLGGEYIRASRFSLRHGLLEQFVEQL